MTDDIRDLTAFYKWVKNWKKELEAMGEAFTTSKREFAEDWWRIHERRYSNVPLPPDVAERRQVNDSLHRLEKHLEVIERNTSDTPWLISFVAGIFKSGAGEANKKFPSRSK